jgi:glycosyltransferase involved in cell wall biosynthesis
MPTYNRGHFIAESLDSVLPQLGINDELIVVDDGSTDKTGEIMQPYLKDPRVRYVFKEHTNAPDTRNRAIDEAKNPWLLWLDSDDILMPHTVARYLEILNRCPDVDVVYGNLELFGLIGHYPVDKLVYPNYYRKNTALLLDLFHGNRIPNPGVMVKKVVYETYGKYDTRFLRLHDYEFWVRTAPHITVKHCLQKVCRWRWHDSNMSSGSVNRDLKYDSMIIDRYLELYPLSGIFPYVHEGDRRSHARAYFEIGRRYRKVSDYAKAVDYLLKSLRLNPLPSAYIEILLLAVTLSHLLPAEVKAKIPRPLLDQARVCLQTTIGKTYEDKYTIASLHKRLGNLEPAGKAFAKLAKALQRTDKYPQLLAGVYFHLGELRFWEKEFTAARQMFAKCIRLRPDHGSAARYLQEIPA